MVIGPRSRVLSCNAGWGRVAQGFPDAYGSGGFYPLVDRERLPQMRRGVGGVAVLEVAVADTFPGACFLQGDAGVAGDGERLGVVVAGLAGGGDPGRELAKAVQRRGLGGPVTEVPMQLEGLLVAGGGGLIVA